MQPASLAAHANGQATDVRAGLGCTLAASLTRACELARAWAERETPTNYTLPGINYTAKPDRWADLWPWFAWAVVLAVADASLAAALAFWHAALSREDPTLRRRVETFTVFSSTSSPQAATPAALAVATTGTGLQAAGPQQA
jgi:hypothetical protein